MRLRLRIERNELPPVSVLWAIGNTEGKQTVAQFLARVDERFPIEGGCWGAEDYSVSVGGYELLHYYEVGSYFQNEDEVVIKPLSTAEVRARRFTGREQISRDGRHMVDGVPWGKPCVKRPMRTDLNIPPRKKQRTDDGPLAVDDGQTQALVRFEDELEDEDEEDDMDFELDENDGDSGESSDDEEDEEEDEKSASEQPAKRRKTRSSTLKLSAGPSNAESEDPDESDDVSSSDDDSDSSEDDSSSDDSSDDSSSDSDDASSEASWNGIDSGTSTTPHTSNSSLLSETVAETSKPGLKVQTTSAPFEGKSETRIRNSRRRDQRKLKHLKQLGVLPSNATLADMAKMPTEDLELQIKKNQVIRDAFNTDDLQEPEVEATNDSAPSELLQAQAALNEAHNMVKNGMTVTNKSPLINGDGAAAATDADDEAPEVEPATLKRKRLDVGGTNRFIFGHLGVRTPKTQAEKEALQQKLSDRAKQHGLAKSAQSPAQKQQAQQPEEGEEDLDAWADKVQLSAVECIDEGVILSTPPFPFQQRWDPQYQYKNPPKRQKKRKTNVNGMNGGYVETYDKYNSDGTGDALNYDDPEDDDFEDDSYWEEGALLDDTDVGDEEGDSTRQQGIPSDGFPALPDDPSTLPTLAEADARVGDYVVFSELAVSAATGWQPGMISRTVRLEGKDDSAWIVAVAKRDLPPKEYNNEGNRVYSKFEMEGLSEEEGDDGEKTLQWSEMLDAKLLQRAATE